MINLFQPNTFFYLGWYNPNSFLSLVQGDKAIRNFVPSFASFARSLLTPEKKGFEKRASPSPKGAGSESSACKSGTFSPISNRSFSEAREPSFARGPSSRFTFSGAASIVVPTKQHLPGWVRGQREKRAPLAKLASALVPTHFPVLHSFSKKKALFITEIEEKCAFEQPLTGRLKTTLVKEQEHIKKKTIETEGFKIESKAFQNERGVEQEKKKKYYTSYSKLSEIKLLTIGVASPLRILQWAEKALPNGKIYGEVLNANTLHHKTFKPQKGGLFCERIFGPLKDFECACGKIDKSVKKLQTDVVFDHIGGQKPHLNTSVQNKTQLPNQESDASLSLSSNQEEIANQDVSRATVLPTHPLFLRGGREARREQLEPGQVNSTAVATLFPSRKFCPDCDVEYTWSVIRRYQLGYIKLSSPVTHIWFLKGTPSYLSLLLDMKKRYLQFVTYCSETLTIEKSSLPFYSNRNYILDSFSLPSFLNQTEKLKETRNEASKLAQASLEREETANRDVKGGPRWPAPIWPSDAAPPPSGGTGKANDGQTTPLSLTGSIILKQSMFRKNVVRMFLRNIQKFYGLEKPSSNKDWSILLNKGEINRIKGSNSLATTNSSFSEYIDSNHLDSKDISKKHPKVTSRYNVQYMGKSLFIPFLLKKNSAKQGTSILSSLLLSIYYKSFSLPLGSEAAPPSYLGGRGLAMLPPP